MRNNESRRQVMKISKIDVQGLLGAQQVTLSLTSPVVLVAGDNAAGKSSVREAVRAAFLGMPERVLKKKDLGQLVHEGMAAGAITVEFDSGTAQFTAPGGDQEVQHDFKQRQWEQISAALPYCMDPALFAASASDDRRKLLFGITGASSSREEVQALLQQRNLDQDVINAVMPMLRSGFPAAAKFAEERCRDAKASWKVTTGETYGHVKAQAWQAQLPADVDLIGLQDLESKRSAVSGKIDSTRTRLGAAEQKLKAWLAYQESRQNDQAIFDRLPSLEKKLAFDEAELEKWKAELERLSGKDGARNRKGLVHELALALFDALEFIDANGGQFEGKDKADALLYTYQSEHGALLASEPTEPEDQQKLPQAIKAHGLMVTSVAADKRAIEVAKAAGSRLESLATVEQGSEREVEAVQAELAGLQQEFAAINDQLKALTAAKDAREGAERKTQQAQSHHQLAQQWQAAIDALSPDGIPAEILAKAIGPVNEQLQQVSETFDWPCVYIDEDMMVSAGGRAYVLLSESERWRTNTILALVLANLSGARFVTLDQVDVLSLSGRSELIDGMDHLAEASYLDTALLFGTFKKLPNFAQFPQCSGHWLENGQVIAEAEALRALA